jgi:predicted DNA-binding ribbon-helix-helix protein
MLKSTIVKRSVVVNGHKTSVSLEDEYWRALKVIAGTRLMGLSDIITKIDGQRERANLSSAIRLFVLDYYRSRAADTEAVNGVDELMSTHRSRAQ